MNKYIDGYKAQRERERHSKAYPFQLQRCVKQLLARLSVQPEF